MTAKEELERVKMLKERITNNEEEIVMLNSLAERMTSVISGEAVSRTRNADTMTDVVAKIMAVKAELIADTNECMGLEKKVLNRLKGLAEAKHYGLLYRRYILNKTWEKVAEEMGYSYQWVSGELHDMALAAYAKLA